jgi:TrmH family RNA methyltransferase
MLIKSHQNQTFKELIKLKDKKNRDKNDTFLVEGKKQVEKIPNDWHIKKVILSEDYAGTRDFKNAVIFSGRLFAKLSSIQSSQEIITVVEKKHYSIEEIVKKSSCTN